MGQRYSFIALIISFLFLQIVHADIPNRHIIIPKNKDTKFYPQWSKLLDKLGSELDNLTKGNSISAFLFNQFAHFETMGGITVFGDTLAPMVPVGIGLIIGVGRKVIENNAITKSYTVIDNLKLGVQPSLFYANGAFAAGGTANMYFHFTNIRQVGIDTYSQLLPISELKNAFEKLKRKEDLKKPPKVVIDRDNETYRNFVGRFTKDPMKNAYFGKLWNPISQAFNIPLGYQRAKNMADNEIRSYSINGGVSLSICLGIVGNCGPVYKSTHGLLEFSRKVANIGIFFQGTHQISVLKEEPSTSGTFVQVMLKRINQVGLNANVGGTGTSLNNITNFGLEGNFFYDTATSLISFKPFAIDYKFSVSKIYDSIYRFNLDTKEGREAYTQASFGGFKTADLISRDENGDVIWGYKNNPVTRLKSNHEKRIEHNINQAVNLILVNFWKNKSIRNSIIDVQNEVGETKYFENEVFDEKQIQLLFAFNKGRSYRFLVSINEGKFQKENYTEAISAKVEANKYSNFTTPKQYMDYALEFESAINQPGVFPFPPMDKEGKIIKENIGPTKFQLTFGLDGKQIMKFINYPQEKMWSALEKSFGIKEGLWTNDHNRRTLMAGRLAVYAATLPVSIVGGRLDAKDDVLVANIKYERWHRLKNEFQKGPKEFSKALGNFLNSGEYGSEMVKLIRYVLIDEEINTQGSFSSYLLPDKEFKITPKKELPKSRIDGTSFAFEHYLKDLVISNNNLTDLSISVIPPLYLRIKFHLNEVPKKILVGLYKYNRIFSINNRTLIVDTIENKNIFKKGENIFFYKINDKSNPFYEVAKKIELERTHGFLERYRFNMAASYDGKNWTSMIYSIFQVVYTDPKENLNDFIKSTVSDENICQGRFAFELKAFLGERPLFICPQNSARDKSGFCINGMKPYPWFNNKPLNENIIERDKFIDNHCPKLLGNAYLNDILKKENICNGIKGSAIIKHLEDLPFFVCPSQTKNRDQKGFCISGIIPYEYYSNYSDEQNLRKRNEWLIKNCGI